MRSSRTLLVVAAVLAVAGGVLVAAAGSPEDTGWFAYAPDDGVSFASDVTFLFLTPGVVVGGAAVWAATLLVAGVVGHRLARHGAARD